MMFVLERDAPSGFANTALAFAQAGLSAQNSRKQAQRGQEAENGQPAYLSSYGIPVFTTEASDAASLSPDKLTHSSWVFFLLVRDEVRAIVSVRQKQGRPCPSAIEFFDEGSSTSKALRIASELTDRDGSYNVRLIEISNIHASFIWVVGPDAAFVDRLSVQQYNTDTFARELLRRWNAKRMRPPEPDPDREPSEPPPSAGPGGMGD